MRARKNVLIFMSMAQIIGYVVISVNSVAVETLI